MGGVIGEALRLIFMEILLKKKGLKLNPITIMYYVSPCSTLCLFIPWIFWEQCNKHLEDEHTHIELQRIRENRRLARKRLGDFTPVAQQFLLEKVNRHLEGLLAKANRDKDFLHHMKNHYWARMHVCKARMKVLKGRLAKALKRIKRPDSLQIFPEASLKEHGTWWYTPSSNSKKFGEILVNFEIFL